MKPKAKAFVNIEGGRFSLDELTEIMQNLRKIEVETTKVMTELLCREAPPTIVDAPETLQ